jgi:uncharacterized membrane protein
LTPFGRIRSARRCQKVSGVTGSYIAAALAAAGRDADGLRPAHQATIGLAM